MSTVRKPIVDFADAARQKASLPSELPLDRFQAVFDALPSMYLVLTRDFRMVAANLARFRGTTSRPEDVIGKNVFDVFPDNPEDPEATGVANLRASLERVLKYRVPDRMAVQKYDIPKPASEGAGFEVRYWSPLNVPVLDATGEVEYIIHQVDDVTDMIRTREREAEQIAFNQQMKREINERKHVEARLQASERLANEERYKFEALFSDAPAAMALLHGPHHVFEKVNPGYEEYVGRRMLLGKEILEALPELKETDTRRLLDRVFETGIPYSAVEVKSALKRGLREDIYVDYTYQRVLDGSGAPYGIFIHIVDVTDKVLARRTLFESEARFRTITNVLPQIVWSALPNGYHDYFNDRFYEYTGLRRGGSFGNAWDRLVHPEDRERLWTQWRHSIATGDPYEIEYRVRSRSGQYRWVLARALPVRDQTGQVTRWMGTSTDIQEQKELEDALNEAVRAREEFLSIASHELKTPLTTMRLHSQLQLRKLGAAPLEPGLKAGLCQGMEQTQKQIDTLIRLVEEMLDVSRIRAGKLRLERSRLDLGELVRETLQKMADQFQAAQAPLPILESCAEAWGDWDPLRLEQVVTNLLTNAIRYGKNRPVHIRVDHLGRVARLSVRDQGIGIAPESLGRIFERFERATGTSATKGLGLGLYISKQIVKSHGGHMWVESELGRGSTFFVDLDLP